MTDNRIQTQIKDNRKNRARNPDQWKQSVRKRQRQSGQSYINTNGVAVRARSLRAACGATCRLKCSQRFTAEQRQYIHDRFWLLSDEKKNYFYWKYTSRTAPKKRRPQTTVDADEGVDGTLQDTHTPRREYTFHYTFELDEKLEPVCSKFFFATLDITSRRIYYFYDHHYDAETCTPRDEAKRGLNPKPSLPNIEERLDALRAHILSTASAAVEDFNIAKMYKSYAESIENPLKRHWYYKICKDQLLLGQHKKVDNIKSKAKSSRKASNTKRSVNKSAIIVLSEDDTEEHYAATN